MGMQDMGCPRGCLGLTLAWSSLKPVRSQRCVQNRRGVSLSQRSRRHSRLSLSAKKGPEGPGAEGSVAGGALEGRVPPQPGSHCAPACSIRPSLPSRSC